MAKNWNEEGIKAGKTEGWMNLEESLEETLRDHPNFARDIFELVQTDIDGWEETDHFTILYGSKMMDDAQGERDYPDDDTIEKYQDYKSEFWEGYLTGRKSIGKDIYGMARKLIDKRSGKSKQTVKKNPPQRTRARKTNTGISSSRR